MYIPYYELAQKISLFFPKNIGKKIVDAGYDFKLKQNLDYISKNRQKVFKKLKGRTHFNVAFYVYDDTKWKCQSVYDLMEESALFTPYIFVTKNAAPGNNCNYQTDDDLEKVYDFFKTKDMRVLKAFDCSNQSYIPFEDMKPKPDIIIYQHPWYVETSQGPVVCSEFALTYYVPYFFSDSEERFECDLRFHRYIYKYYIPDDFYKNLYSQYMPDKGQKLVTTGYPFFDYFYLNKEHNEEKYTIYAPHWTVCGDNIRYGTFDWNGWKILEYAETHPELNWVFKPHPLLYKFLCSSGYMSKEKADEYYNRWRKAGILYDKGDYLDLFQKSRMLITDCGSFLIEYFLTEKPCIHLRSEDFKGNKLVREICKNYYETQTVEELEKYLHLLIDEKQDPKMEDRKNALKELSFVNNYCAKNILEDIIKDIG